MSRSFVLLPTLHPSRSNRGRSAAAPIPALALVLAPALVPAVAASVVPPGAPAADPSVSPAIVLSVSLHHHLLHWLRPACPSTAGGVAGFSLPRQQCRCAPLLSGFAFWESLQRPDFTAARGLLGVSVPILSGSFVGRTSPPPQGRSSAFKLATFRVESTALARLSPWVIF